MEEPKVRISTMWLVQQYYKDGRWYEGNEDYTEADAHERKAKREAQRPDTTFRIIKRTRIWMDEVIG